MLETKCVGDKFEMLMTDLIHWKTHQHIEKSRQHKWCYIMILPPTSQISHHHKVTNITISPTLLSPTWLLVNVTKKRVSFGHALECTLLPQLYSLQNQVNYPSLSRTRGCSKYLGIISESSTESVIKIPQAYQWFLQNINFIVTIKFHKVL